MTISAAILLALHPARTEVLHPAKNPSAALAGFALAGFALAGAVPLVWFGLTTARLQRTGLPADPHVKNDHWSNMAAMAFGLVLMSLLASVGMRGGVSRRGAPGSARPSNGLASTVFHRFPGTTVPYPGIEGIVWGLAAVIGGLAFVVVAEWEARRRPQRAG